jgi:hypothetical protein
MYRTPGFFMVATPFQSYDQGEARPRYQIAVASSNGGIVFPDSAVCVQIMRTIKRQFGSHPTTDRTVRLVVDGRRR